MTRTIVILITDEGAILLHGDDLPNLKGLEELVGDDSPPEVEEITKNCRLCG